MRIGELSKKSGMASHTIRFYESKGLMPKSQRAMNGYRVYDEESLQVLSTIQCAKKLGFSLDDMSVVLEGRNSGSGLDHDKILKQLDVRLIEVEEMMGRLVQQREGIKSLRAELLNSWGKGECLKV